MKISVWHHSLIILIIDISSGQFSDDYTAMSAILQTAYTSPNGCSNSGVLGNARSTDRGNADRDIDNGTNDNLEDILNALVLPRTILYPRIE